MLRILFFYIWHFRHSLGFFKDSENAVYCMKCGRSSSPRLGALNDIYRELEWLSEQEQVNAVDLKNINQDIKNVLTDREELVAAVDSLMRRIKNLDELADHFNNLRKETVKESRRLNHQIVSTKNRVAEIVKFATDKEPDPSIDLTRDSMFDFPNEKPLSFEEILVLLKHPGRSALISQVGDDQYRWTYTDVFPPHDIFISRGWYLDFDPTGAAFYRTGSGSPAALYYDGELVEGQAEWIPLVWKEE